MNTKQSRATPKHEYAIQAMNILGLCQWDTLFMKKKQSSSHKQETCLQSHNRCRMVSGNSLQINNQGIQLYQFYAKTYLCKQPCDINSQPLTCLRDVDQTIKCPKIRLQHSNATILQIMQNFFTDCMGLTQIAVCPKPPH